MRVGRSDVPSLKPLILLPWLDRAEPQGVLSNSRRPATQLPLISSQYPFVINICTGNSVSHAPLHAPLQRTNHLCKSFSEVSWHFSSHFPLHLALTQVPPTRHALAPVHRITNPDIRWSLVCLAHAYQGAGDIGARPPSFGRGGWERVDGRLHTYACVYTCARASVCVL